MIDETHPLKWNGIIDQNGYNLTWPIEHDSRGREIHGKAGIKRVEQEYLTDGQLKYYKDLIDNPPEEPHIPPNKAVCTCKHWCHCCAHKLCCPNFYKTKRIHC